MDLEKICFGCMSAKGPVSICPICGWDNLSSQNAPNHLPTGTVLKGRYLLGKVLGQGGFGVTYIAWDLTLEIKLAIKEYMPQNLASRSPGYTKISVYSGMAAEYFNYGMENFIEEARMLAKFNSHPGIVTVHDFFKENSTAYLIMEYLSGLTLQEYLNKNGNTISFDKAFMIMIPVMDALKDLHGVGLLHRDISPDNIYISREGYVKLLDFGAARYSIGEYTKSLSVILKPGYAPEEQYRSRGNQGPWTDIYALGATIYRAITGEIPLDSLERIYMDTLTPPKKMNIQITNEVETVLLKALSVKAEERYQTIEDFYHDLLNASQTSQINIESDLTESQSKMVEEHPKKIRKSLERKIPKTKRNFLIVVLFLLITSMTVLVATLFWQNEMVIPSVLNLPYQDALQKLKHEGFFVEKIEQLYDSTVEKGRVIAQDPIPNTKASKKEQIFLKVSKGPELFEVPSVINKHETEGVKLLESMGFTVVKEDIYTDDNRVGQIVSQKPEVGEMIPKGEEVKIMVYRTIKVPSIVGLTVEQAMCILENRGLLMKKKERYNTKYDAGQIFEQSIPEGLTVLKDTTVVVNVSKGPLPGFDYERDTQEIIKNLMHSVKVVAPSVEYSDKIPEGYIIKMTNSNFGGGGPGLLTSPVYRIINVVISLGPECTIGEYGGLAKYYGELKGGVPHGIGYMQNGPAWEYSGEFKDNKKDGNGIYRGFSRIKIYGVWQNDEIVYYKRLVLPDGSEYELDLQISEENFQDVSDKIDDLEYLYVRSLGISYSKIKRQSEFIINNLRKLGAN